MKEQSGNKNHMWRDVITQQELNELYINQQLSIVKIAKLKNCADNVIGRRLRMWDIPRRDFKEQVMIEIKSGRLQREGLKGELNPAYIHGNMTGDKANRSIYVNKARKFLKWECEHCKATKTNDNFDLIVNHRDLNNRNNELTNLQILCQACHASWHAKLNRIKVNCRICGKITIGLPSKRYCSRNCMNKAHWETKKKNPIAMEKNREYIRKWRERQ